MVGVALAGGRSSRFGGEKAVATLRGRPLLQIALERLGEACKATAVSAVAGSQASRLAAEFGVPVLHDAPGHPAGPLAGLCAALAWAQDGGAPLLATLPCDLPLAPPDLFERLARALQPADGGVVVLAPDGVQPLCAIVRTELHAPLAARLASGEHPAVQGWLEEVRARRVPFAERHAFLNVNTREDLARAERLAETGQG